MKEINICIVGGGNISNTRHIPALRKLENVKVIGVLSNRKKNVEQTRSKWGIPNGLVIEGTAEDIRKLQNEKWFNDVDAMVVGVPPKQHYQLVKLALKLGKHVLVEKPMMMNKKECDELIKLAKEEDLQFSVMHNFQFAEQMLKLNKIIEEKKHGEIISITEIQFTNRDRRLPEWYNDLPLGLFFDEAAHFIYLLQKHCGKIKVENAYAMYDKDKRATPITLNVDAMAGSVPVHMMLNFNAPICEWYYMVSFKKVLYVYDFFKDILIEIPTDNEHLSKDVLKNSLTYSAQYWGKFTKNGFKMVTGNLLYGHDVVLGKFVEGIRSSKYVKSISAERGRETVIAMNEIIKKVNK